MTSEQAEKVRCPMCHALHGKPCVGWRDRGLAMREPVICDPHEERVEAARRYAAALARPLAGLTANYIIFDDPYAPEPTPD